MKYLAIFFLSLTLLSCNKINSSKTKASCPEKVIIDETAYQAINGQNLRIVSASIENDCLNVKIKAGGCSGSSWKLQLIGTNFIIKTGIPKRLLKLDLENNEDCEALITKDYAYDLTPYKMEDCNKFFILIDGWKEQLTYEYE